MPGFFSAPKVPSGGAAAAAPPQSTALTAQIQQLAKRQGQQAAVLSGPKGVTQRGSVLTHSLTGQ